MLQQLLAESFFPFTLSLALFFGLLGLELVLMMAGATLLGGEGIDAPDADGMDVDLDADIDFDGIDADASDFEIADAPEVVGGEAPAASSGGLLGWLGLGRMPMAIWLASVLVSFGLAGLTAQSVVGSLMGGPLPATLIALPAGAVALWFARSFGGVFARLVPKTETEALSENHLGRRRGVVSQGTAARGRPAEVRVTDRYGNSHYLRAEPLRDEAEIVAGTEVMVLRHRYDGGYFLVPLTD